MEHIFTTTIKSVLEKHFEKKSDDVFEKSLLIQYINEKTRSANKGSKSRSSFGNLYAIYVLIEDYIANGYNKKEGYSKYEGALFNKLLSRQRELPFGSKLQNHALNSRMNAEFESLFKYSGVPPIVRNLETSRYWINHSLLKLNIDNIELDIAEAIIEIINEYIKTKQDAFQRFIQNIENLQKVGKANNQQVEEFIIDLLAPNVDARLFEIVSYSILKYFYNDQQIIWGFEMDKLNTENLKLYKTGRTNANDGGIDFVMKPLGRFFQVTETLDFKKYFLDIDKIQKYPITFVIKSNEPIKDILDKIRSNALKTYSINIIVNKYMDCIEEVINIPTLTNRFIEAKTQGYLTQILDEIVTQSKVEFNYEDDDKN